MASIFATPSRPNREKTALTTGTSLTNAETPLLSFPLSYIRSGRYYWVDGSYRSTSGSHWASTAGDGRKANRLVHYGSFFTSRNYYDDKGYGFSLRYVTIFAFTIQKNTSTIDIIDAHEKEIKTPIK